jgi:DegV family protein with EDD domain
MSPRSVAIVVDSTAFIPRPLLDQYDIHVVPNVVVWGHKSFRDGVDIQPKEFFERLRADPVMPTTAANSAGEFRDVYARAAETAQAVVAIHVSAKLSPGTQSAAVQAREMLAGTRVEIVESESTAMALGFVVLAAARAAAEGATCEPVIAVAKATIPHVGLLFTVETLDYLRRGGRIGGAQAFIGNLMDVKPILELKDGRVEPMERARSKKRAVTRILEVIEERTRGKTPLRLATIHAAADEEAAALLETARSRLGATEAILAEASPTVAVHAGPGTVGLAWCVEV